ncbi:MAG: tetratricopeptide repeat protein [Leptospirillum sp.]
MLKKIVPFMLFALLILLFQGCAAVQMQNPSKRSLMEAYSRDMRSNHFDLARSALLEGTRRYPSETVFWNDLAYLDFRQGHYPSAEKMLNRGLRIDPGNQGLLLNEARLYLAEGRLADAKRILFQMLPRHPWLHGYRLLLAIVEVKDGNSEAGRILFEDLYDHHPGDLLVKSYIKRFYHLPVNPIQGR